MPGITNSTAVATNGIQQVGSGYGSDLNGNDQAIVWSGTANSAVNLQFALPSDGVWTQSDARSIDAAGNVFGIASGTYNGVTGSFAVEWSPVPEPASLSLLLLALPAMLVRRRRARAR